MTSATQASARPQAADPAGERGRRLLVVSYHFGSRTVGGLRWHGFAKHLARRGWQVDVVTATDPDHIESCPGVSVYHRAPYPTLDDLYQRVTGRSGEGRGGGGGEESSSPVSRRKPSALARLGRGLYRIRKTASELVGFPDPARGWILPAASTTRMLLRRHAYRLVVSSGPPHSCHVATAAAVRGRGVPYWVDMRDPWIGRGDVEDRRTGLIQSLAAWLERWVFDTGALILTNSAPYAAGLRDVYPELVVETIPNGVDVEKLPAGPPPEPYPEVTLAHVGTIYLKRDVGTVVSAIRRAQELRGGPPARLRLVGSVAEPYRTQVLRQVREAGLEDAVELTGRLPRPQALDILRRSTFAVVLAQAQRIQVPGKLYECVAMGVPTIVITEPDSATAEAGRAIGAFVFADGDVEGVARLLASSRPGEVSAPLAGGDELSYQARTESLEALMRRRLT